MGAVAFIEVLDRRGRVALRHALETLPATVGRAYHNTVILDDRYASAVHLRLEQDEHGAIAAVDAGSENGLYEVGRAGRRDRVTMGPGTRLRVGETVLRLALPGQPVPPALSEPFAGHLLGRVLASRGGALGLCAAAAASQTASRWLSTYTAVEPVKSWGDGITVVALLALWAGGWALATRLLTQRGLFLPHLGLVSLAAIAGDVLWTAGGYVEYLAPALADATAAVVSVVATVALGGALIAGHLALTSTLTPARRLAWAFGLVATLIGAVTFVSYAETGDDDGGEVAFGGGIKPLGTALVASAGIDPFALRLEKLRSDVDSLAARPR